LERIADKMAEPGFWDRFDMTGIDDPNALITEITDTVDEQIAVIENNNAKIEFIDDKVFQPANFNLAWEPVEGAVYYQVIRGNSPLLETWDQARKEFWPSGTYEPQMDMKEGKYYYIVKAWDGAPEYGGKPLTDWSEVKVIIVDHSIEAAAASSQSGFSAIANTLILAVVSVLGSAGWAIAGAGSSFYGGDGVDRVLETVNTGKMILLAAVLGIPVILFVLKAFKKKFGKKNYQRKYNRANFETIIPKAIDMLSTSKISTYANKIDDILTDEDKLNIYQAKDTKLLSVKNWQSLKIPSKNSKSSILYTYPLSTLTTPSLSKNNALFFIKVFYALN